MTSPVWSLVPIVLSDPQIKPDDAPFGFTKMLLGVTDETFLVLWVIDAVPFA